MKYDDLIGAPFIDGGRDKETGLDCWGLAREMFRITTSAPCVRRKLQGK